MNRTIYLLFLFSLNLYAQTSWELLNPRPSQYTGEDIEFVNNNKGYIINSEELLETVDAGATWTKKLDFDHNNTLNDSDLDFNGDVGLVVGTLGYALRTEDGGDSWSELDTGYFYNFESVAVIDSNTYFIASNNNLIKTFDGGVTWTDISTTYSLNSIFFFNELVGHATAGFGRILKTIDGGVTWALSLELPNVTTITVGFRDILFTSENIGYTYIGERVYKTTNGGDSWFELYDAPESIFAIHFIDDNTGFIAGEFSTTFKTIDGGLTWTGIAFGQFGSDFTNLNGVFFTDSNNGYVIGQRGRIGKTIDGGNTWTQYSPTYRNVRNLNFPSTNIGYFSLANTSNHGVYKTTDGGDTWSLAASNLEFRGGMQFLNDLVGYAAGISDEVYKTVDGGVTWVPLSGTNLTNEALRSLEFVDENYGFVSGGFNFDRTYKTIDGGQTWQNVGNYSFGDMSFVNQDVGYAIFYGDGGIVMKTIDGGLNWFAVFNDFNFGINSIDFLDENHGYFVVDETSFFRTEDGGTTWIEVDIPWSYMEDVKFYTTNIGYIADEDGHLYHTSDGGYTWGSAGYTNGLSSIVFNGTDILISGNNGVVMKNQIEYDDFVLNANQAIDITNNSATISGSAASNGDSIENLMFEFVSTNGDNINLTPSIVNANESIQFTENLTGLLANTTYSYRLKGVYQGVEYVSNTRFFTTLPNYDLQLYFAPNNLTAESVDVFAAALTNGTDLSNIEFQFSIDDSSFDMSTAATPNFISGGNNSNLIATLTNLEPETTYYYRLKAVYEGVDVYSSNTFSFTTFPSYEVSFFSNPIINGNEASITASVRSYTANSIDNISIEYGTSLDFGNDVATTPNVVNGNSFNSVTGILANLNVNETYYYRIKGILNSETIYSDIRLFNFTSTPIAVSDNTNVDLDNLMVDLTGYINPYNSLITNIGFEYGLDTNYGSFVSGTPNVAFGTNTTIINAQIDNLLPNETYNYRLLGNNVSSNSPIYSENYQFSTNTLGVVDIDNRSNVFLYPNPAKNEIILSSSVNEVIKNIVIFDSKGRKINTIINNISSSEVVLNISTINSGLYFVEITLEENKSEVKKFIKH